MKEGLVLKRERSLLSFSLLKKLEIKSLIKNNVPNKTIQNKNVSF